MASIEYRNWKIRKSGKQFYRVYNSRNSRYTPRVTTIKAGKALIDCLVEHRVMTPAEHKLIYPF